MTSHESSEDNPAHYSSGAGNMVAFSEEGSAKPITTKSPALPDK